MESSKKVILESSLDGRIREVENYQINIDNYTLALEEISSMSEEDRAELAEFTKQLSTLLSSEKLEQKKAKVMLAVIKKQLEN